MEMTNEELEKQAEEYATEDLPDGYTKINYTKKLIFIDGAKWGIANAIEWHDLRKNPDDLPKETKDYIIYHEDNTGFHHYSIRRFSHNHFECTNTILAWCELPQLKE